MARLNIVARAAAAAIVIVGIVAISDAALRPTGKSEAQCRREARALLWNENDEADQWGFKQFMAQCQYGRHADEQMVREHETWKAGRQEWLTAKVDQRRRPSDDWDRRALAQAEPRYRHYGVSMVDICRDLAATRSGGISQSKMRDCMAGKIPR